MQTEEQKKLIDQYCNGEITGEVFTDAIDRSTKASNDGNTMLDEVICPICKGDGFTTEHDPMSMDWNTGEHNCCGCPIQVGCENCQGTGKVKGK